MAFASMKPAGGERREDGLGLVQLHERQLSSGVSGVVLGKQRRRFVVVPLGEPEPVHRDQPTAGPQQLSPVSHRRSRVTQCPEKMAARHGIETRGGEVRRHGIAEPGVNGDAACGGLGDQLLKHGGRQVDRRHAVAERCRGQGHVAGSGGYIEDIGGRFGEDRAKRVNPRLVLRRAVLGDMAPMRLVAVGHPAPEGGDVSLGVVRIDHTLLFAGSADEFAQISAQIDGSVQARSRQNAHEPGRSMVLRWWRRFCLACSAGDEGGDDVGGVPVEGDACP